MRFSSRNSFLTAAGGVVVAAAVAACAGAPNSPILPGSSPGGASLMRDAGVRRPAPSSTEFFTGITPNSNPRGIANGPRQDMWFTQTGTDQIGRITAKGVVTEYAG
ncbi:MAG: hypothetical protein JO263_05905, partial [Candidatus Eremiobacteraeota bacterium]|nr:hypothetical protein [Candidatus Eremiobacteraeota bacterium]